MKKLRYAFQWFPIGLSIISGTKKMETVEEMRSLIENCCKKGLAIDGNKFYLSVSGKKDENFLNRAYVSIFANNEFVHDPLKMENSMSNALEEYYVEILSTLSKNTKIPLKMLYLAYKGTQSMDDNILDEFTQEFNKIQKKDKNNTEFLEYMKNVIIEVQEIISNLPDFFQEIEDIKIDTPDMKEKKYTIKSISNLKNSSGTENNAGGDDALKDGSKKEGKKYLKEVDHADYAMSLHDLQRVFGNRFLDKVANRAYLRIKMKDWSHSKACGAFLLSTCAFFNTCTPAESILSLGNLCFFIILTVLGIQYGVTKDEKEITKGSSSIEIKSSYKEAPFWVAVGSVCFIILSMILHLLVKPWHPVIFPRNDPRSKVSKKNGFIQNVKEAPFMTLWLNISTLAWGVVFMYFIIQFSQWI